jgi:VWFA-related protein
VTRRRLAPAAAAAVLLASCSALAQEIPVFRSAVEVVRLDVAVLRDGKRVDGLGPADFEVKDDGVLQTVEVVGDEDGTAKPLDVVLALDVSDSVRGEPLARLKAAAHAFVDLLRPDDSFSLLTFASRVERLISPADSRERAHEVIESTTAELATSLHDAAYAAVVTADATRGRPLALILSDGEDHGSWLPADRVLRAAQVSELVAHAVFMGPSGTPPVFLRELASATGGEAWRADYGELREALARALAEFRNRYTLRYERTGTSRPGFHRLEIRVKQSGAKVRARAGYLEEAEPAAP